MTDDADPAPADRSPAMRLSREGYLRAKRRLEIEGARAGVKAGDERDLAAARARHPDLAKPVDDAGAGQ